MKSEERAQLALPLLELLLSLFIRVEHRYDLIRSEILVPMPLVIRVLLHLISFGESYTHLLWCQEPEVVPLGNQNVSQ